jgi:hypothetical protein
MEVGAQFRYLIFMAYIPEDARVIVWFGWF